MTHPPRSGDAVPVDDATTRSSAGYGASGDGASEWSRNGGSGNGYSAAGSWGGAASASSSSSAGHGSSTVTSGRPVEKLPAPDTPTASVPPVKDDPRAASGTSAQSGSRRQRARGPRRARLQLRHINPWTVLKFSCVLAVALFFVWLIVVGVLYGVLDAAGVINKINDAYQTLKSDGSGAPITAGTVFGAAAIIGLINIVLFIALSTIGSVVYNLCADLVGGVEVTLSER